MSAQVETAIFDLLAKVPAGKSISPEEVARAVEPERWRRLLGHVRTVAVNLAKEERLVITRHGKPADPADFRGVYRLKLPGGEVAAADVTEPGASEEELGG